MLERQTTMRVPCGKFCGRTAPRAALFGGVCLPCLPREQAAPRIEAAAPVAVNSSPARPLRAAAGQGSLFG